MRCRFGRTAQRSLAAGVREGCIVALCLGGVLLGQDVPQAMTRLVVRLQSPDIPKESFAAKPKVIYRAGTGYCRIEELPDEQHGIHGLMIINEPDTWMVNLLAKTAQHYLDSGPTFNCRLPIFVSGEDVKSAEDLKKPVFHLEFGRELAYFEAKGATSTEGPILQGSSTRAYTTTLGDSQLYLFTAGTPERPSAIALQRGNGRDMYWYAAYEQLPFDARLFAKPRDVKIEEVKQ
jgi:hypothetical protein